MANRTGVGSEALMQMDLDKILRAYLMTAISSAPGYKALLLDKETMRTCSTMFGRSELADSNVVHIERLDAPSAELQKSHVELRVCCALCSPCVVCALHTSWPQGKCKAYSPKQKFCVRWEQAVVFVRPTRENITLLKREVKAPRFMQMNVCECVAGVTTQHKRT
jgi:hypothetical protein